MEDKHGMESYESFCDAAKAALDLEADRLLDGTIARLSENPGTWHPNGFAVFHVDAQHELGDLRLHIWPNSGRTTRPDAPPIHTHVWHLCSRILAGTYAETLFEDSRPEWEGASEYTSAEIDYLLNRNSFYTSGKAHLRPSWTTVVSPGQFHTVPAGVAHETNISEDLFVATLLLTSRPILEHATVFGTKPIPASTYTRPVVSKDQQLKLLQHLERELESQSAL